MFELSVRGKKDKASRKERASLREKDALKLKTKGESKVDEFTDQLDSTRRKWRNAMVRRYTVPFNAARSIYPTHRCWIRKCFVVKSLQLRKRSYSTVKYRGWHALCGSPYAYFFLFTSSS